MFPMFVIFGSDALFLSRSPSCTCAVSMLLSFFLFLLLAFLFCCFFFFCSAQFAAFTIHKICIHDVLHICLFSLSSSFCSRVEENSCACSLTLPSPPLPYPFSFVRIHNEFFLYRFSFFSFLAIPIVWVHLLAAFSAAPLSHSPTLSLSLSFMYFRPNYTVIYR